MRYMKRGNSPGVNPDVFGEAVRSLVDCSVTELVRLLLRIAAGVITSGYETSSS